MPFTEREAISTAKWIAPTIHKWYESIKEQYKHICEHTFLPFIQSQYNELDITTSILSGSHKIKISEVYVPLTISKSSEHTFHGVTIDKFPKDLFLTNKKIVISDNAGMGKSTILKMLYRYTIEQSTSIIPVYIDLKSLISHESICTVEQYILENYPSFTRTPSLSFIKELLSDNPYLFLFDGADEVPDDKKDAIFKIITSFCKKAKASNFLVASRKEDKILSSFPDFEQFNINPLTRMQSEELLLKCGKDKSVSERLIIELRKPQNAPVIEFLGNPLLTTLLHAAYQFKKKIPLKKNLFYSQIFNALFEDHDSNKPGVFTREIKSQLSINDFEEVLSAFAYQGRPKEQLEYDKGELNRFFKEYSDSHPTITFDSSKFIDDLVVAVPVLKKDGLIYTWQHKSLQEYFFVRHITTYIKNEESTREIINRITDSNSSEKYKLILDLFYDEQKTLFHDVATRKLKLFSDNKVDKTIENPTIRSFHLFHKFYHGSVDAASEHWATGKIDLNTRDLFLKIEKTDRAKALSKQGYSLTSVSYAMTEEITIEFAHNLNVLLEVLSEKGEPFVSEYIRIGMCDEKNIRYEKKIDEIPNVDEIEYQYGITYILDEDKLNEFMLDFDDKYSKHSKSSLSIPHF